MQQARLSTKSMIFETLFTDTKCRHLLAECSDDNVAFYYF